MNPSAGTASGTAGAAIANAIKASGAIVRIEPEEFQKIMQRVEAPLIVYAEGGGFFGGKHKYLVGYKGLVFYTKHNKPLALPEAAEIVRTKNIWAPM